MPVDVKNIPDDCGLLRRINEIHLVPDRNSGRRRLSSGAFRAQRMSVDAECLLAAAGLDWNHSLKQYGNYFLVRLQAGIARQHAQSVDHTPQPDNYFHTDVVGKKSNPICRALRDSAEWVKRPDNI